MLPECANSQSIMSYQRDMSVARNTQGEVKMGQPTQFVTVTEEEFEKLDAIIDKMTNTERQIDILDWMEQVLMRNCQEIQITSRARQLQDSQLLAAASFNTSKTGKNTTH